MHEKTLKHALSGGPMPAECRTHLDGCESCRKEIEALRKIEADLRDAAPVFNNEKTWTDGLAETIPGSADPDRATLLHGPSRWFRAAALGAMAAGFVAVMALLTGGPAAPSHAAYLAANGTSSVSNEAERESSYLFDSETAYTTADLLSKAETMAAGYDARGDEINELVDTVNGGNWNG